MPLYRPLVKSVIQSKFGYWIVTLSIAPGLNMPVMVCKLGITPEEAAEMALMTAPYHSPPVRWQ